MSFVLSRVSVLPGNVIKTMTYLIVSEGVTASTASTIPAPSPAIDIPYEHLLAPVSMVQTHRADSLARSLCPHTQTVISPSIHPVLDDLDSPGDLAINA